MMPTRSPHPLAVWLPDRSCARVAWGALALALGLPACSSDPAELAIVVTFGQETDALSRAPAVTRVDLVASSADGSVVETASAAPGDAFDLGEVPDDMLFTLEVTGVDASGATVLRGRSLGVVFGGIASGALPVFAQRTDAWARPPRGLSQAHVNAPAASLAERYLFTTGGDDATQGDPAASDFYDLLSFAPAVSGALPRVARSMLVMGSFALLIGDDGATWVDFDSATYADAELPDGLASFADVAGGPVVVAPSGVSYVVGPARATGATAAVLQVGLDGTLRAHAAGTPRAGAAAAWIDGVGLVVAGGSADGPGVEVFTASANAFSPRSFPPDPTAGAGMVPVGPERVALLGGVANGAAAASRTLDLACLSDCMPGDGGVDLPVALTRVEAFQTTTESLRAILIGQAAADPPETRTFLVDIGAGTALDLPLREPRRGATPVAAPNGTLALVGGVHLDGTPALSVETWFPQ